MTDTVRTSFHSSKVFLGLLITVIAAILVVASWHTTHAASVSVRPITPASDSYNSGTVSLSSKVEGLEPSQYEMFWAVGNGEWNRMTTNSSTKLSSANVDISNWNWQADNTYILRFIALVKNGWYPVEASVLIKKGIAPVSTQLNTPPALSTGSTSTVAKPETLYVDPSSSSAQRIARGASDVSTRFIASQPAARWFGDWNANIKGDVDSYVTKATTANEIPQIVLYNIPSRDCGSHSSGGATTYENYFNWGKQVANGINGRKAIVIVEPDALASMDCLSSAERLERTKAISNIVELVKTAQSKVYVDAGNSAWHSADVMSARLRAANIQAADGFSLNISNFRTTSESAAYGNLISAKTDSKHFVIDTSRNGKGPSTTDEWCNPSGRGLGSAPSITTYSTVVDAYLWVKTPGESDGSCGNGAPAAGQWWQSYADALYANKVSN